jgi:hypothetical protein
MARLPPRPPYGPPPPRNSPERAVQRTPTSGGRHSQRPAATCAQPRADPSRASTPRYQHDGLRPSRLRRFHGAPADHATEPSSSPRLNTAPARSRSTPCKRRRTRNRPERPLLSTLGHGDSLIIGKLHSNSQPSHHHRR